MTTASSNSPQFDLIGCSSALRELQADAALAAGSTAKVLITGESGVGKELIAQLIHRKSSVWPKPLITVNCAGIPDTLLESELFGHLRGSFTGAYRDKPGRLQLADGGMVFLDEIGEMSHRMQALLLRFLETGELQPVGGLAPACRVDTRVICATNRNVLDRVEQGEFRRDLYYRVNVVHLVVSPLRERSEDILPLVDHFARVYSDRYHRRQLRLTPDALDRLVEYSWPGNVRELKNVMERIVVRSRSDVVTAADLPREVVAGRAPLGGQQGSTGPSHTDALLHRMLVDGESFWTVVYPPFVKRDLTRDDLRTIVQKGLERTRGNYRMLVELFNMPAKDYRRFLILLRKHDCQQPFQAFRTAKLEPSDPAAIGAAYARKAG